MPGIKEEREFNNHSGVFIGTHSIHWITEPTVEELPQVERTQTDRINRNLLKSFLTRLNTDPQFQNVVSGSDQPEEQVEETPNKSFD